MVDPLKDVSSWTPKINEYLNGDFLKGNWDDLLYQVVSWN